MRSWIKHLHRRDYRFLAFVLLNLVCLSGYLLAHLQTPQQENGGWRRIDVDAVMSRIESGDLLQHEASWYHIKEAEKRNLVNSEP